MSLSQLNNKVSRPFSFVNPFVVAFVIVFLTFRSFSNQGFYLSWLFELLALFIFAIGIIKNRFKISHFTFFSILVNCLWLIAAAVVTVFAFNREHHITILIVCLFYTIASCVFYEKLFVEKAKIMKLTVGLTFIWALGSLGLLFLYFVGANLYARPDFSGFFNDRNVYAIASLIITSFVLTNFHKLQGRTKKLYVISVGLIFLLIIVSRSITGVSGVFILICFILFQQPARKTFRYVVPFFILLITALVVENPIQQRMDRFLLAAAGETQELVPGESAFDRLYLLVAGWELAKQYFWTGVGLDNARFFVSRPLDIYQEGVFLHNTYLDILTSGGFFLFLLYYILLFTALVFFYKKRKEAEIYYHAFALAVLTLLFDFTWTNYFEFSTVFSKTYLISLMLHHKFYSSG